MRRVAGLVVGLVVLAVAGALAPALTASAPGAVTTKVLTVLLENHSLSQSRNAMPYLDSLATAYGQATGFQAITHPSLGNYLAAASGQGVTTCGLTNPLPSACPQSGPTVLDQALGTGHTARLYAENMPSNCAATDAGGYVAHHNPWAYFLDPGPHADCLVNAVPAGTATAGPLLDDIAAGTLPDVGWVIPNNTDNGHDAGLAPVDLWLQMWLPKILAGPDYVAGRLAVGITWDEPDPAQPVSTPVGLVVVSPNAAGRDTATPYTLYSWLRYQEDVVGVPYLGAAAAAADLQAWVPIRPATPAPSPTATPTPAQPPAVTPTSPSIAPSIPPSSTSTSTAGTGTSAPRSCPAGRAVLLSTSIASLSRTSARVTAVVNPNGSDTRANAEWGTTKALGHGSAKTALGSGCTPVTLTATLTGLTPGTVYYWRVVTESKAGNSYPPPQTFLAG